MTQSSPSSMTLSVRVANEMYQQLEELSDATGRTKSYLAAEAIDQYLRSQAWQVTAIKNAVKKSDRKNAKFVNHSKVADWVNSWDSKEEQDIPCYCISFS